jgi:two-component system sensor histidine kinase DegS
MRRQAGAKGVEGERSEAASQEAERELEERANSGTVVLSDTVRLPRREAQQQLRAEESLRDERRTLQRLLQSSDYERRLIAYEIHDGVAQYLAGALMHLQTFEALRDRDRGAATEAYEKGLTLLRQGLHEARRLIGGVRDPIPDAQGITAALARLARDCQGPDSPRIEYCGDIAIGRLHPTLENAIYRIAQAALANACKHSKSKRVRVSLTQPERRFVQLEIRDWGVGFNPRQSTEGCFGLEGIRERARLLDGRATIHSVPGKGTRVLVHLPLVGQTQEDNSIPAQYCPGDRT